MKVVILAPINSSPLSILLTHMCTVEPGVEVVGIVLRKVLNFKRLRFELRLLGPEFLRKVWEKLILGSRMGEPEEPSWKDLVEELGLRNSSLRKLSRQHKIPLVKVAGLNEPKSLAFLKAHRPDLIVFTGGGLIRKQVLEASGIGVLNAHRGILPLYRGMDLVAWTILDGRQEDPGCGVTLHFMDMGVDTGAILKTRRIPVNDGDTFKQLRVRVEIPSVELMMDAIRAARDGTLKPKPQRRDEGRQYYIMHPRLVDAVKDKLAAAVDFALT